MKKYKSIGKLLAVSFLTAAIASACTEDAMDKINENPNNPLDAPAKFFVRYCVNDHTMEETISRVPP